MTKHTLLSQYGKSGALKRWGVTTLEQRIWSKVDIRGPDECWNWTGCRNRYGYIRCNGKNLLAHRKVYELRKGPIPKGMCVCHSCDNGFCCNPDHLWIGTHQQNTDDMVRKQRYSRKAPPNKGKPGQRIHSDELVAALKKSFVPYKVTAKELSERFGLSFHTVRNLIYHMRSHAT